MAFAKAVNTYVRYVRSTFLDSISLSYELDPFERSSPEQCRIFYSLSRQLVSRCVVIGVLVTSTTSLSSIFLDDSRYKSNNGRDTSD